MFQSESILKILKPKGPMVRPSSFEIFLRHLSPKGGEGKIFQGGRTRKFKNLYYYNNLNHYIGRATPSLLVLGNPFFIFVPTVYFLRIYIIYNKNEFVALACSCNVSKRKRQKQVTLFKFLRSKLMTNRQAGRICSLRLQYILDTGFFHKFCVNRQSFSIAFH